MGLEFHDGKLHLKAGTGSDFKELAIESEDLKFNEDKRIEIRILDFNATTMLIGDKYDKFVSEFLCGDQDQMRLAYHYSDKPSRPIRPKYQRLWPETYLPNDISTLNGTSSYTIMNLASFDMLNGMIKDTDLNPERFRSNIYLKSESGIAFEEDAWTGKLRIGDSVVLRYNKPNNRCKDTTLDPVTLERHPEEEPLKTLRTFRLVDPTTSPEAEKRRNGIGLSPLFCVNFAIDRVGVVNVGDDIFAEA